MAIESKKTGVASAKTHPLVYKVLAQDVFNGQTALDVLAQHPLNKASKFWTVFLHECIRCKASEPPLDGVEHVDSERASEPASTHDEARWTYSSKLLHRFKLAAHDSHEKCSLVGPVERVFQGHQFVQEASCRPHVRLDVVRLTLSSVVNTTRVMCETR